MSGHVIADETTTTTTPEPNADPGWLALSAALTDEVPTIADREDLLVTIAPGAGHGAPACFLPTHATIELDGTHLAVHPATATPHSITDRARYPTAWGLLTHECAHARHSTWQPPHDAPLGAITAALLLEESRIEAAHIRRRPDDRHWLRASATDLILADTHAQDPTRAPRMTPWDAAHTAALLLGRTDAGILTPTETEPVAHIVDAVLGTTTLAQLRTLWQAAHQVADHDADAMLDLGRRWCDTLNTNPHTPPTTPEPPPTSPNAPTTPSPLTQAITETLATVAHAVASEPAPADPAAQAASEQAAEHAAQKTAAHAARTVFSLGGPRTGRTAITGTRAPTHQERAAARQLARALTTAGTRDRITTTTTSPTPPGRLRMRGALAADAQRAAGALPTAEPFTRTTRRTAPTPPLRLGIACDISGSMRAYTAPVASAAWILAHAAHHTPIPTTTATVIFGNHVRPITYPHTTPTHITEFTADDNYEDIPTAIDALDHALNLTHPNAARLLVIVSDGHYRDTPRQQAQTRINRLRATGCAILCLTPPRSTTTPLHGTTTHPLTDPTTTAHTIGRAATTALRAART